MLRLKLIARAAFEETLERVAFLGLMPILNPQLKIP
jgi:hypothetical protein